MPLIQPRHPKGLILGLIFTALILFTIKYIFFPPQIDSAQPYYSKLIIKAAPEKLFSEDKIRIPMPFIQDQYRIVSQNIYYEGWKIQKRKLTKDATRGIYLSRLNQASVNPIYLEYTVKILPQLTEPKPLILSPQDISKYTEIKTDWKLLEPKHFSATTFASQDHIAELLNRAITQETQGGNCSASPILLASINTLKMNQIPARLSCGVILQDSSPQITHWAEFYWQEHWHRVGMNLSKGTLFIPFIYDTPFFYKQDGSQIQTLHISLIHQMAPPFTQPETLLEKAQNIWQLSALPYDVKEHLKIILALPIALLLIALIKQFFKLESLGILTPALLGMAIAFNEIWLSLLLILIVLIPAAAIRYFAQGYAKINIYLLMLTIIALFLSYMIAVMDMFKLIETASDALVPVIITLMLADKFITSYNRSGAWLSMKKLMITLGFATLTVPIITFDPLGSFLLHYPEIHLITLALALYLNPTTLTQAKKIPSSPEDSSVNQ